MASALDVIQLIVEGYILAQRVLSVYEYIVTDATPDEDILEDFADQITAGYTTPFMAVMSDDLDFSSVYFKNMTSNTLMGQISWPGDQPSGTVEPLPLGNSMLITAVTATPGTRGRKFLPGASEGNCNDTLWNTTTMNLLTTFGAWYIAPFIGVVSGSPYAPGVRDKNGIFRVFTEALVSNIPAYQRRRKQGVGE